MSGQTGGVRAIEHLAHIFVETEAVPVRTQLVRDTTTGAVAAWAIYDRASLVPWASIAGPAIVAEDETSTLIGPGWAAVVNGLGYLEMTKV